MNRRTNKLWSDLENFLEFKFPKELKIILQIAGFDSELSLKEINEKAIESIEQVVDENITGNNTEIISVLKDSIYGRKPQPFRFLLGHKILISSIPEKIDLLKKNKKTQRFKRGDFEYSQDSSQGTRLGPEEYKNSLLLKLKKYANKFDLVFEIKLNHIKKFSQINNIIQYVVQCCFCEIEIPCKFITYWQISNLTKHIRGHLQNQNPVNADTLALAPGDTHSNLANNTPSTSTRHLIIERNRVDVLKEIDKIPLVITTEIT